MVDAAPLSANEIGLGGDSVKVEDSPRLLELSRGLLAVLIIGSTDRFPAQFLFLAAFRWIRH